VGKVRRQENRELLRQEDERLKGTKYIWLYREENLPDKHRPTLRIGVRSDFPPRSASAS